MNPLFVLLDAKLKRAFVSISIYVDQIIICSSECTKNDDRIGFSDAGCHDGFDWIAVTETIELIYNKYYTCGLWILSLLFDLFFAYSPICARNRYQLDVI